MNKKSNRMILESLGLPFFEDIESLSDQLRLSEKLVYFLSKENAKGKYKKFKIKKKDGTNRYIYSPCLSLKIVQRWVLNNILYKIKTSQYSYGFIRETQDQRSPLLRCAEKHKNNLYILKMDLENFFPSITRKMVFTMFLNIGYNTYAANLLTNICTVDGILPQGAVTSPYIANLICRNLDNRLAGYCNKRDITYTRYADDLTFSSDNRNVVRNLYGMVEKIADDEGFKVNKKKTHFLTPKTCKKVVGVTVNDGLTKAPKDLKKKVRAMIHYQIISADYSNNDIIRGYVSYIDSIEKGYKKKIIKYINSFIDKDICVISDIAIAFNNNKLFPDVKDMSFKKPEDFVSFDLVDAFLEHIEDERHGFLNKNT